MNITKYVPSGITRMASRQVLNVKINSPHILFAVGVVGTVGATVLACRATLKLEDTLDEIKGNIDTVKELSSPEDRNKNLAIVYAHAGLQMTKLYGPSVVLGGLSMGALTGSHIQLSRRNTALTAAYTGLSQAYDRYRDRVRAAVGEDKELAIYRDERIEEFIDADGKKQKGIVVGPDGLSPHARFFDESSRNWKRSVEANRLFLKCQENYANEQLHARGYVFLNDVYDTLGIPRTSAGQIVGWVRKPEDGDGYVSFGLDHPRAFEFTNGTEQSVLLDFNIDGIVFDLIDKD